MIRSPLVRLRPAFLLWDAPWLGRNWSAEVTVKWNHELDRAEVPVLVPFVV